MDQHNQERRRHFHRGRRGSDRRGPDRRTPPGQEPQARNGVDVEQIMREIRARIAQRGIELSNQEIQELAARRLEAILDPRAIKPALLDELKRGAAAPMQPLPDKVEPPYTFEESTIYESHNPFVRFMRALLRPLLRLLFNPAPVAHALAIQSKLNVEAAKREAERVRQQAEWNALHYEVLQRLVTEIARVSIEMQSLTMKVESLSAKVDFNERRVRGIEGVVHHPRGSGRVVEPQAAASAGATTTTSEAPSPGDGVAESGVAGAQAAGEGRRRRRRRRGRRGGGSALEGVASGATAEADTEAEFEAEGDVDAGVAETGDEVPSHVTGATAPAATGDASEFTAAAAPAEEAASAAPDASSASEVTMATEADAAAPAASAAPEASAPERPAPVSDSSPAEPPAAPSPETSDPTRE